MRMMKKMILAGALFLALGSLGVQAFAADLKVVSATPKGQQNYMGERTPITVTFNQPVAKLAQESALASDQCPLAITPQVKGSCRYSGTQSLLFEPAQDWPLGTQYTITLPKGFASAVNGAKELQLDVYHPAHYRAFHPPLSK